MAHTHSHSKLTPIVHGLAAICWGAVPVWFHASDRLHAYLKGPFQTYALIGGLGLIVLGVFNILTAGDDTGCGHDHCDHDHEHDEDHDHEHGEEGHVHADQNPFLTVALMIVPVVFSVLMTQDSYSAETLRRKGAFKDNDALSAYFDNLPPFTLETLTKYTPQNENGDFLMEISQIFWSSGDAEVMEVLDGISIELRGQIMPEEKKKNPDGNRLRLYQLFMNCCAADATVIGVPLQFEGPVPKFPTNSWVQVNANIAYSDQNGKPTAYLQVRSITPSENPERGRNPFGF